MADFALRGPSVRVGGTRRRRVAGGGFRICGGRTQKANRPHRSFSFSHGNHFSWPGKVFLPSQDAMAPEGCLADRFPFGGPPCRAIIAGEGVALFFWVTGLRVNSADSLVPFRIFPFRGSMADTKRQPTILKGGARLGETPTTRAIISSAPKRQWLSGGVDSTALHLQYAVIQRPPIILAWCVPPLKMVSPERVPFFYPVQRA